MKGVQERDGNEFGNDGGENGQHHLAIEAEGGGCKGSAVSEVDMLVRVQG